MSDLSRAFLRAVKADKSIAAESERIASGGGSWGGTLKAASASGKQAGRMLSEELLKQYPDGHVPLDAAR